jgi:hypothetical protein
LLPQGAMEENKKVTAASWEKTGELKNKKAKKRSLKRFIMGYKYV